MVSIRLRVRHRRSKHKRSQEREKSVPETWIFKCMTKLRPTHPGGLSYRPVTAASGYKKGTSGLNKDPGPETTHQVVHPISTGRTWVDQVIQSSVTTRVPLQTEMRGQNIGQLQGISQKEATDFVNDGGIQALETPNNA